MTESPNSAPSKSVKSACNDNDDGCDGKAATIEDYDAVLFTVCDVFGRPRGKFAVGDGVKRFVKQGMETPYTTCVQGLHSELPTTLSHYKRNVDVTCLMYPDLTTLRPLSWLCKDGRKVGHVLCDLYTSKGERDPSSPREMALKQLAALKKLGYEIMSAHETEYIIYHKGTLNAMGGDYNDMINMWRLDKELSVLYDHMLGLLASGIPVETQMEEFAPGQIEFSMVPQYGIKMADSVHRLRYVTKALCNKVGFEPTFMTRPRFDSNSSGFHFNHSLWTLDGRNAFYDPKGDHKCSDVMRHWLAGLMHHGIAMCAIQNPTVNCYDRLHGFFAPSDNVWNYNDRNARIRVKNKGSNIYLEDRGPSAACNPYLSLAAVIAAGIDGITNKLELPPPRAFRPLAQDGEGSKAIDPLPSTLKDALEALKKDKVLKQALGENFVEDYILMSQEFQLDKLKDVMDKEPNERIIPQRELYLHSL